MNPSELFGIKFEVTNDIPRFEDRAVSADD